MIEYTEKRPSSSTEARRLTEDQIRTINRILSGDQRVELIPTKDGVRVIRIKREEVKKTT